MNDLIDTTEMYLRTIYELEEEGVVPLRARIAERLKQSGPTVSQTVARMERDGLLVVADDRHLQLTEAGRSRATAVMRKHRLAERLLVDIIGLEWEQVHAEACRWEHVISDAVEEKLIALLGNPTTSPYGNPIPARSAQSINPTEPTFVPGPGMVRLDEVAHRGGGLVQIRRIAEHIQLDPALMSELHKVDGTPGNDVVVGAAQRLGAPVQLTGAGSTVEVSPIIAHDVVVSPR